MQSVLGWLPTKCTIAAIGCVCVSTFMHQFTKELLLLGVNRKVLLQKTR